MCSRACQVSARRLAQRLLIRFASVERVVTADEESLAHVRGHNLPQADVPKTVPPLRIVRCDSVRNTVAADRGFRARIYDANSICTTQDKNMAPQLLTGGL
jgi:hypothetical protein